MYQTSNPASNSMNQQYEVREFLSPHYLDKILKEKKKQSPFTLTFVLRDKKKKKNKSAKKKLKFQLISV